MAQASQVLSLTVTGFPPLVINTVSLPDVALFAPYSQQLQASGGIPPYTWSITLGSLPAGLSLSSSGLISGSPTAPGPFSFTVQVKDSGP
jgi:hypothetical protein